LIFKTYESDIKGFTKQLGFSKRSFSQWGKDVSAAFTTSTGFVEKFKNTFSAMIDFTTISSKDWIKNTAKEIITADDAYIIREKTP